MIKLQYLISESDGDFDEAEFLQKYDPKLWQQWLRTGEADLSDMMSAAKDAFKKTQGMARSYGDTQGCEVGHTNFPYGFGYPGKEQKLSGDKWKKLIHIDHFADVDFKISQRYENEVDRFLVKNFGVPYYLNQAAKLGTLPAYAPIRYRFYYGFEGHEDEKSEYMRNARRIKSALNSHGIHDYDLNTAQSPTYEEEAKDFLRSSGRGEGLHISSYDTELVNGINKYMIARTGVPYEHPSDYSDSIPAYSSHPTWTNAKEKTKQILAAHGITDYDVETGTSPSYERIVQKLRKHRPHPIDDVTYPSYVSAYDVTRELGGHEEGGWWYDNKTHRMSIRVKNRREALKAAIMLFKMFRGESNGLIEIYAERNAKGIEKAQKTPEYS